MVKVLVVVLVGLILAQALRRLLPVLVRLLGLVPVLFPPPPLVAGLLPAAAGRQLLVARLHLLRHLLLGYQVSLTQGLAASVDRKAAAPAKLAKLSLPGLLRRLASASRCLSPVSTQLSSRLAAVSLGIL